MEYLAKRPQKVVFIYYEKIVRFSKNLHLRETFKNEVKKAHWKKLKQLKTDGEQHSILRIFVN